MRLTTRGRHAVTALLYITLQEGEAPVSLTGISAKQGIPLPFLEQIAVRLRQNGLLISVRGPRGGYRLGRLPAEISVADIMVAVEEEMDTTRCGGDQNCLDGQQCLTHALWQELNEEILQFLTRTTLQTLKNRAQGQKLTVRYVEVGA